MVLELHLELPTTQGEINPALLQVAQRERNQPESSHQEDQVQKATEEQGSTEVPATSNKEELVQDQIEGMDTEQAQETNQLDTVQVLEWFNS